MIRCASIMFDTMRPRAVAFAWLAVASLAVAAPHAEARDVSGVSVPRAGGMQTAEALPTDVSASRKQKRRAAATPAAAAIAPAAVLRSNNADPSTGPGIDQLRQLQHDGRCVIDEGYGRYSPCSNE